MTMRSSYRQATDKYEGLPNSSHDSTQASTALEGHRTCMLLSACGLLLVWASPLRADDAVVVKSESGRGEYRVTGIVVDYNHEILVLRHANGREERLPAPRVVDVLGDWKPKQRAADTLFTAGDFAAAADAYREALTEEDRRWVKRRVLSQMVWCYRATGKFDEAIQSFLILHRDGPKTPYFAAIPLAWTTGQPDPALERRAAAALKDQDATAKLLGASWLLSSTQRSEALRALQQLASDSDARLVFLAEAQLWRTQIATAQLAEVERWQTRVTKMPSEIRCGPLYILGQAWTRVDRHEEAAMALLQAGILHPQARDVVPHALLAAARELEEMKQPAEAATLYREIVVQHTTSAVATQAEQRLQAAANSP